MRNFIPIFVLLVVALFSFAEEQSAVRGMAASTILGARYEIGSEKIDVALVISDFDSQRHDVPEGRRWGWDPRPPFDGQDSRNTVVVDVLISIDGNQLPISSEHLKRLFNAGESEILIRREKEEDRLQVAIFGGHTPEIFHVTFFFEEGIYLKRVLYGRDDEDPVEELLEDAPSS